MTDPMGDRPQFFYSSTANPNCQLSSEKVSPFSKTESPARLTCRALFWSVFSFHKDRTEELYFITLVLILTACSPVAG